MSQLMLCILHCPKCHTRHIDRGEWRDRPHHRHQCEECRFRWIVQPHCIGVTNEELWFGRTPRASGVRISDVEVTVAAGADPKALAAKVLETAALAVRSKP
jgi:hypothetical protein